MASQVETNSSAYVVDIDVPCTECGYNLRGLEAGARCPECGRAVGASLLYHRESTQRLERLRTAEPKWVKALLEGCALLLLVIVLWTIFNLAPDHFFKKRTQSRSVMLGVACMAWVCTWAGIWKITGPAPRAHEGTAEWIWRWLLRTTASVYVMLPVLYGITDRFAGGTTDWRIPVEMAILAGVLSGIALYQRLSDLAVRLPSAALSVQLRLLSVAVGVVMLITIPSRRWWNYGYDDTSLDLLRALPSPVAGLADIWRQIWDEMWSGSWSWGQTDQWLVAIVSLWCAVLLCWIVRMLWREFRLAKQSGRSGIPSDASV